MLVEMIFRSIVNLGQSAAISMVRHYDPVEAELLLVRASMNYNAANQTFARITYGMI